MKQYYLKPGYLWMYASILLLMVALGVIRYATRGVLGLEIGVGLVLLLVTLWSMKVPILKLHDDHFAMKIAPAARLQLVRYGDIRSVDAQSKKKLLVTVESKGTRSVVKIPLAMLRDNEATEVTAILRGKIAS